MTFPIDIHIANTVIPSHLITDILSFYLGYQFYTYLYDRTDDHISSKNRWSIIIGGLMGGFLGSRLLASLEDPYLFLHPGSWIYYLSGKTIVGGLLGAIVGVEIVKKFIKEKKSSGDLFVYPLILAMMNGRVGCFLTGVTDGTVGNPSNLRWAFDQGDGIARHPTSLYEILFLGLLWIVLYQIQKRIRLESGVLFKLFVIGYTTFRFFVEFIKPTKPLILGLSSIQLACLIFLIGYIILLAQAYNKKQIISSS